MTYELAKQLKDAGFPQDMTNESFKFMFADGSFMHGAFPTAKSAELSKIPTLSELIEACGGRFQMLVGNYAEKGWGAIANTDEDGNKEKWGGPTPEEAVAHLWLALHNA